MRKIFLVISVLVLAVLGIGLYKYKYQPTAKTKEISVSSAELAQAEKIEQFLSPKEKLITEKARERVTRRKILEREIPNFKIDSNAPAFSPDGRFFPQDLAATYNYDYLLTEAVRQKVEGSIKIDIISVKFVKLGLKDQAEKVVMGATPSAGITVNRFSQTLVGEAAKKFQSDAKPIFENSPMGTIWIFRTIVSKDNGLGMTFDQWYQKKL